MTLLIILAVIAGIVMILIAALVNQGNRHARWRSEWKKNDKDHTPIKTRPLLTVNELPIFLKLRKALPDHIILTQVALSALLSSTGQVTRNRFNRYRADFVILDKEAHVVAIIELNDESHKLQNGKVDERHAMLTEANYHVIRYSHTPDIEQIQRDCTPIKSARKVIKPTSSQAQNQIKPLPDKNFFEQDY
ncbi:MAG: DUF2726 domain-containing protein [Aquirhabdus sp.]